MLKCNLTFEELATEINKDIRYLFLQNQIREDGQIKRNPKYFTPWSARNFKYTKEDKQRMLHIIQDVAFLNSKNIWQFRSTDIRWITVKIRDKAIELDSLVTA